MADVVRTTRKQSLQMAGVIAGSLVGLNSLFWVMSNFYYEDKPQLIGDVTTVRIAFATLSLIIAVMSYAAGFAPRLIGHALGFVVGIVSFIAGIFALVSSMPAAAGVSLMMVGLVMPVLAWRSAIYSRAAWSFLISLLAVLATVTFFGAPKIRHVLHIGLWHALIIPGLMIVAVIALSMVRGEYRRA